MAQSLRARLLLAQEKSAMHAMGSKQKDTDCVRECVLFIGTLFKLIRLAHCSPSATTPTQPIPPLTSPAPTHPLIPCPLRPPSVHLKFKARAFRTSLVQESKALPMPSMHSNTETASPKAFQRGNKRENLKIHMENRLMQKVRFPPTILVTIQEKDLPMIKSPCGSA